VHRLGEEADNFGKGATAIVFEIQSGSNNYMSALCRAFRYNKLQTFQILGSFRTGSLNVLQRNGMSACM
jgi:hypothetical protein